MTPLLNGPLQIAHDSQTLYIGTLTPAHESMIWAIEKTSHAMPWLLENIQSSLQKHHVLGLFSQQQLLAYAVFTVPSRYEAELILFVVDKPWWGKGLASCFLRALLTLLKERVDSVFLEVRESNKRALNLYEAVGFNAVGERKGYYPGKSGRKENAIIYAIEFHDKAQGVDG